MGTPIDVQGSCSQPQTTEPVSRTLLLAAFAVAVGMGAAHWLERGLDAPTYGKLSTLTRPIRAHRAAIVATWHVRPGQVIAPGDLLVTLHEPELDARIAEHRRQLQLLDEELSRLTAVAELDAEARLRDLQQDQFNTQLKLRELQQQRASRQIEQLAWDEHLQQLNGEPRTPQEFQPVVLSLRSFSEERVRALLQYESATTAIDSLQGQIDLCQQRAQFLSDLQSRLREQTVRSSGVAVVRRKHEQMQEQLASEESQLSTLQIRSEAHGVVGPIHRAVGSRVLPEELLAESFDLEAREIIAEIPSMQLHRLPPGQKVRLTFPGRQAARGLVCETAPQRVSDRLTADGGDAILEVPITPVGADWPLVPIGTRVRIESQR